MLNEKRDILEEVKRYIYIEIELNIKCGYYLREESSTST